MEARIESGQQICHQAGISMNYHFCRQGGIMRHIYAHAVLDKNPIAYYRLAETSGPKVHDKTGNGHTGVVGGAGAPSFSEPGAILSDPEDTAIAFDGQSYIEIPNDPVFSQPTSQTGLTVEAWLRPDRLDFDGEAPDRPYIYCLGKGGPGQREWAIRFYSNTSPGRPNRISAYLFNPDGKLGAGAYTEDPLTEREWIYIAACFDPGDYTVPAARVSIYRNGVQSAPSPGQLYNNPQHWQISPAAGSSSLLIASRDGASIFTGAIDEVAIYPRVLSADEVMDNYTKAS
jgi:hypothetical protein